MPFASDNSFKIFEVCKQFTLSFVDKFLQYVPNTCSLTLAFVNSWFIVLLLTELFNFSQIFVCDNGHRSSAAFLAIGSVRVMNDDTSQEPH